jgi:hypothetical protein
MSLPRAFAVVISVVIVVVTAAQALAGAVKPERVSDASYARQVCTALASLQEREATLAAEHSSLDASRPKAFQREAVQLLERYVDRIRAVRARLATVAPRSAPNTRRAFDRYFAAAIIRLDRTARTLQHADAEAVVFPADVATFEANLQFLAHQLPDPFARIDDEELVAALRGEPACRDIVTIGQP